MQLWQYCLLVTARLLYVFRTLSASIIRSTVVLLMMDAESVRNMWSNLALTNKQYCQSCILLVLYII